MKKNSYVEKLNWDSTFFRQNIGKITLSDRNDILTLNNLENNNQYDVIYVFSNVLLFDDIVEMCLTNSNFIHVDRKVTLELNLDLDHNKYEDFDDISIASNVSNDIINLAYESGHLSRFYKDERFRQYFPSLYKLWIEKDFLEGYVFVKTFENKIVGLLSVTINDHISNIGLVAVDTIFRGQGIGVQLFNSLFSFLKSRNVKLCRVVTQSENDPALKLYDKVGFKVIDVVDVWHYWR